MRLALLGIDDDSLRLARWAEESGRHEVVVSYGDRSQASELKTIAPDIRFTDDWEELLLGAAADAVIVGRGGQESSTESGLDGRERRADQLRKLVQAGVPMIVVCPASEAIVGFEIEMIRSDTNAVIVPYVPGASHPAMEKLGELVSSGENSPIGKVEQISLEREQADRSRDAVLVQLARDVTLLRKLIGTIQTVSASGPAAAIGRDPLGPKPKELPSLANLSVHLGGERGLAARWSISPAASGPQLRLTLIGQRGKAVLNLPAGGDGSLDIAGDTFTTESFERNGDAEEVLALLSLTAPTDGSFDDTAWLAACRDQEAAEAVDRSLARGRTVELFNEEHTEEASFKGIMAMGGCLLLVGAVGVVFLATIVEGLHLPMRDWPLWRLWPVYLLVPIAAFLLLQLLSLAVKRNAGNVRRLAGHGESGT